MRRNNFLPNRRDFVIGGASLAVMASSLQAAGSLAGKKITFYEPYGPNSTTHFPLAVIKDALQDATGASVSIETRPGKAGELALQAAADHTADELAFGVTDLLSLQVAEALEADARNFQSGFQPVGLLSHGISSALIVAEGSPHKTIEDLLSVTKDRPLRIGHIGRKSAFGVNLRLMETSLKTSCEDVVLDTRAGILSALADGTVDAAILVTLTLLPTSSREAPPVRPVLTFGGERNPVLKVVPTLREISVGMEERNTAITSPISAFAPRGMDSEALMLVQAALADVMQRADLQQTAQEIHYPLHFGRVSEFDEAQRRNARIIDLVRPRLLGE
ncbi:MAG: tripartite tricarboxylate transporter substrate-binding protein [Proteobacteria bacterium]|nr:tripartite tricarboxylate transporter substrate-binding protein [Pseudomonadota bacterium]